ncbi:MAG: group II intron maturase-specific domain-containing protein [Pseudomonadota bacterium]
MKVSFSDLDHAFWQMVWRWSKRRHPKKSRGWVKSKYFRRIKGRDWRFVEKGHSTPLTLLGPTWIIRHIKIIAQVNPYDPVWDDYLFETTFQDLNSSPGESGFQCHYNI